jgi:hypothetical protein
MKKYLVSLMLIAASLGLAGSAAAVVIPGSSYSIYVEGTTSGNAFLGTGAFDNAPSTADRGGLQLTLTESDTSLGGKDSRITINLSANGDLFPAPDDTAILAIGTDGDGLDFITPVALTDARVTLRNLAGAIVFASDNLAGLAVQNPPWDGTFPSPGSAFGIDQVGAMGIASITFDFFVHELPGGQVPEPASIMLCGLGLLGLVSARRQRARKA